MPANHHTVLGLTSDASDDAIRAAYKKLALRWHPDRHLVGKERAAQIFIEVNQAYHALMDGKESTHSLSAETSSTTSSPTGSSADSTHSDTHPKSTQASSRPPSASSKSSKRSGPHSSKSFSSAPCNDCGMEDSESGAPSPPPSSDNLKSGSLPRSSKPASDRNQSSSDRMKSGPKIFKPHDRLRDPPPENSFRSKSSAYASAEKKHDSRSRNRPGRSRASKPVVPPASERPYKPSKVGFADEFVHKLSKGRRGQPNSPPFDQCATPYGSPLHAINTPRNTSREWIFPLPLTLDEMYHGTRYRFVVTRELLSHRTEQVDICIDVPPGIRSGTRIVCPRTGHQRKDGTLQDVVFLVEDVPEERFSRVKDDLFLDVCIPWADPLADEGGEIFIQGIDGQEITFTLPYPIYDKATEGQVLVKGAGMPVRDGRKTIGRGDMIVRWRVVFAPHQSKWQTFKKTFHLDD